MEPAQGNAAPDELSGMPPPAAKPKLKRGRRTAPNRAPAGYFSRLADELAAESLARQEAYRAANQGCPPGPLFPPRRRTTEAEAFSAMMLTPSQKRRRRTAELRQEREEKAKLDAAFLAFVEEQRAACAALEKAAADRKERGVKLSYVEWRREMGGE